MFRRPRCLPRPSRTRSRITSSHSTSNKLLTCIVIPSRLRLISTASQLPAHHFHLFRAMSDAPLEVMHTHNQSVVAELQQQASVGEVSSALATLRTLCCVRCSLRLLRMKNKNFYTLSHMVQPQVIERQPTSLMPLASRSSNKHFTNTKNLKLVQFKGLSSTIPLTAG